MNKELKAEWVGIKGCKINGYHDKYTMPKKFFDRNGFVYQLDCVNNAYLDFIIAGVVCMIIKAVFNHFM